MIDMNVMIVAHGIPSAKYPISGLFEFDQAKALREKGISVKYFIVDLKSIRRFRKFGITRGVKDGVEWLSYSIPVGAVPLWIRNKIGLYALKKLYNIAYRDGFSPDVIHAHFSEMGYISVEISKEHNIPLVITEHSSALNEDNTDKNILQYAIDAYSKADACVAVSKVLAENIYRKTGIEFSIIHNTVDTTLFSNVISTRHRGFRFLTVGNLVDIKQHNLLIDAFSLVHKKYRDTKLDIIGGGPLYDKLVKQISDNDMSDCVVLHGMESRDQIAEILGCSDCFVLASKSETFGVACIEAMAVGLPVISTLCGGPEEFVNKDVGILVPNGDHYRLAEAMMEIIVNRDKYSAERIKNYVQDLFAPSIIADQIVAVYRDAIKGRNKRT